MSNKTITGKLRDYVIYSIQNKYPHKIKWIVDMFSVIATDNYNDEFINKESNIFYVKMNDDYVVVNDKYSNEPLLKPTDKIIVDNNTLPIIDGEIETTVGRLILNYLLLYKPFGTKFKYINDKFSIGTIEDKYILPLLKKAKEDDPIIDEYIDFIASVDYIKNFNNIYSISVTEKTIQPPKDINKKKKEIVDKYIKKYGKKALKDKSIIALIDNEIQQIEKEYIKEDKAYGKFVKGKVAGARKKMYSSYGLGLEFTPKPEGNYISDSLYEGWDKDPEKLAVLFNDSRMGSYSRGKMTMYGGVTAKYSLRGTTGIKIKDTDCGTKLYRKLKLTEDNYKQYIGRYIFDNNFNNIELTEDVIKNYIGKEVRLRSPMYCKLEDHYCVKCTGSMLEKYENGITLLVTDIAGAILNESLKKMHNTEIKIKELELKDMIR